MRTVKTLKPGQKGTKELLTRFGPSLLCVRYRYDEDSREHVKTVEGTGLRRTRFEPREIAGMLARVRAPPPGRRASRRPASRRPPSAIQGTRLRLPESAAGRPHLEKSQVNLILELDLEYIDPLDLAGRCEVLTLDGNRQPADRCQSVDSWWRLGSTTSGRLFR